MKDVDAMKDRFVNLLENKDWKLLKAEVEHLDSVEIVELFELLNEKERLLIFRLLDEQKTKDVFKKLSHSKQQKIVEGFSDNSRWITKFKLAKLLNNIEPDDRTSFLEELPEELAQQLINHLSPEQRGIANNLLKYPKESIGRLMTTKFVAIKPDITVKQAFDYLREFGHKSETLNIIYVIDEHSRLIDYIPVKDLILANPESKIHELINYKFISLKAEDDQEIAIQIFKEHDRSALPVVDEAGVLLGIVTFDDIMDVAEEESSEDFHKFGGMEELDFPYVKTPFLSLIKKRSGWLIILFIGEMLTATAMGYFDKEIAKAVVLALFIPLIISSGGNSGSQAATIIIRAMALKEISLKDWWYVMKKEFFSGILLGSVLGAIGFFRITIWQLAGWYDYGEHWNLMAWTVGVSLVGVVLWGTLSGSFIPMILKKLGLDPATASAPFVATLVDVTGIVIYFMVALAFLSGTLL